MKNSKRFLIVYSILFVIFYLLSIYAQDLAYILDRHVIAWHPLYYVTVLTVIATVFFLIMYFYGIVLLIKQKVDTKVATMVLIVSALLGVPRLLLNIFIAVMWWG